MITGDNIHVAVQMAIEAGIVGSDQEVIVLEGNDRILKNETDSSDLEGYYARILTSNEGIIADANLTLRHLESKNLCKYCFAVDNNFVNNSPINADWSKVKIFARITPINKAFIVRRYK